jgi:hypothetical protein
MKYIIKIFNRVLCSIGIHNFKNIDPNIFPKIHPTGFSPIRSCECGKKRQRLYYTNNTDVGFWAPTKD